MPEFFKGADGKYHYANEYGYSSYIPKPAVSHKWNPKVVQYFNKLYSVRHLPNSPVESSEFVRSSRGYIDLQSKAIRLPSEQSFYGRKAKDYHEKSWPTRIGLESKDGDVVSHYFRSFDMSSGITEATSKIISNVVCGRLYPTKMPYYIGRYNGEFGTIGLDLNNINGVKSARLDKYLESKGVELDSVVSFIKAYREGAFKEDLTNSAIAQLMVGMFSLPNAIGEQDPNTRNAILLGKDEKGAKFDSLVRIDFENNRINNSPNQKDSANNDGDSIRVYPFGIFGRDEDKLEFKENIAKMLVDKIITPEEANLILTMHEVTKYASSSRTIIDGVVTDAISAHQSVDENGISKQVEAGPFAFKEINNFAEDVITRADNYTSNIKEYFNSGAEKAGIIIPSVQDSFMPLSQEE